MTKVNKIEKVKIYNLESPRSGKPVPNQFIVNIDNVEFFQSYKTIIAKCDSSGLTLDSNALNYSKTTSKYLFQFTMKNRKELEQGIKDGSIKTANLNPSK